MIILIEIGGQMILSCSSEGSSLVFILRIVLEFSFVINIVIALLRKICALSVTWQRFHTQPFLLD